MGTPSYMWTPWRNGSASDSRSEGCVFESRRGQLTFFAIHCNFETINIEKNKKAVQKGMEIMKQLVKINEMCCCFESFCHFLLYALAVIIILNEVEREVGGRCEGCRPLICVSMDESALGGPLEGTAYNAPSIWGSFAKKACRFQS